MTALTTGEILTLCGELEHSPECIWSGPSRVFFTTEDGRNWTDSSCAVPYVPPPCTCGYFDKLRSGRAKLKAMASAEGIEVRYINPRESRGYVDIVQKIGRAISCFGGEYDVEVRH